MLSTIIRRSCKRSPGVIPKHCGFLDAIMSAMRLMAGCAGMEVYKETTSRLNGYLYSLSRWCGRSLSLLITWLELLTWAGKVESRGLSRRDINQEIL